MLSGVLPVEQRNTSGGSFQAQGSTTVVRGAHNASDAGSNPAPATNPFSAPAWDAGYVSTATRSRAVGAVEAAPHSFLKG